MKEKPLQIRLARAKDGKQIGQLIYDTVRNINVRDYTKEQVEIWTPNPHIYSTYDNDSFAFVAEFEGQIVGFGNITREGYLHRFYVHKDFQGKGIGSHLLTALEEKAKEFNVKKITTEASITAMPFFISKGFIIKEKQNKTLRGMIFINYKMFKKL